MGKEIHATKNDLTRQAGNLIMRIEDFRIYHLTIPLREIYQADVVTITIDGETRVLKDRCDNA